MPRKSRVCEDCGAPLPQGSRAKYCLECAMDRTAEAGKQIREKQGPIYDKWRDNLMKSLEREPGE